MLRRGYHCGSRHDLVTVCIQVNGDKQGPGSSLFCFRAEENLSKSHVANLGPKVNGMDQVHHTMHDGNDVSSSELFLNDPASSGAFKPFSVQHLVIPIGRELTEFEDPFIRKGGNIRGATLIVLSFKDFNSSFPFGSITLYMCCRDSGTIFSPATSWTFFRIIETGHEANLGIILSRAL